jgi:transposase
MAERICCPVSADTLGRRILSLDVNSSEHRPLRVLGVDDWAWRRRRRYGTILVDPEQNKVVDLLPDRRSETLACWLRANPWVEIVARDRAGAYADGIRQGAPSALHVSDRWHILRNFSDAFIALIDRHSAAAKRIAAELYTRPQPVDILRHGTVDRESSLAAASQWVKSMDLLLRKKTKASIDGLLDIGVRTPLTKFAPSLRRDLSAIKNALATPWTTSPAEGQISKLKIIRRTMYGRAGFQLLRARILHAH